MNTSGWAPADLLYCTILWSPQIFPTKLWVFWGSHMPVFFLFVLFFKEVCCLSHSAVSPWTHSSETVVIWHMDPFPLDPFQPHCCGSDAGRQHATPFSGASLMTGLSFFLNKESLVTHIYLLLTVAWVFSPFPSALPSVCRSFSLLFPSFYTVFCILASFLLRHHSLHF